MNAAHENGSSAVDQTAGVLPYPSSFSKISALKKTTTTIAERKKNKKEKASISDCASSASSDNRNGVVSSFDGFNVSRISKGIRAVSTNRRSLVSSDVDTLGLHLGMSIAAFVAQVLERKGDSGGKTSSEYMSKICIMAVRESLANVAGNKYDSFLTNFEKSFQSTLMTLRLISESSQNIQEESQGVRLGETSCSVASSPFTLDKLEENVGPSDSILSTCDPTEDNSEIDLMCQQLSQQLVLHDGKIRQNMSTEEKSLVEQTRSNDLKKLEIGLTLKKLKLKERHLALHSDLNILERWKLSMGFSKASFKAEKFKTQLQEARQVDLLRKCLDLLVAGLIVMLFSLAYGTYVYSHQKIIEVTEACSPASESKSWWMPKSMSTFNTGLQLLKCQVQVLSRMLFGTLLIASIAVLLIRRSSSSHHTMPVTFILLLLGVGCGYAGKFCIYTLGGNGNRWLFYWEAFCLLHFLSNIFHSTLFVMLNGPISVAERMGPTTMFPYWVRRSLFYVTLLVLPLLCGFMPFAGPSQWFNHFASRASDFVDVLED